MIRTRAARSAAGAAARDPRGHPRADRAAPARRARGGGCLLRAQRAHDGGARPRARRDPARGGAARTSSSTSIAPAEIKKAVVGTGGATKEQVQFMLTRLLRLKSVPQPVGCRRRRRGRARVPDGREPAAPRRRRPRARAVASARCHGSRIRRHARAAHDRPGRRTARHEGARPRRDLRRTAASAYELAVPLSAFEALPKRGRAVHAAHASRGEGGRLAAVRLHVARTSAASSRRCSAPRAWGRRSRSACCRRSPRSGSCARSARRTSRRCSRCRAWDGRRPSR